MPRFSWTRTKDFFDILSRFMAYKLTEKKYDPDYCPDVSGKGNFISARAAAAMINDNDTVFSAGLAAHCRCSIFYWTLRDRYLKESSPNHLTWVTTAAHGGRGKAPGTIEEIGIPGLISEYICSHVETQKAQLNLADRGLLAIHTIPYGEITFLLEAQACGQSAISSETGLGTFLDPDQNGSTAALDPSGKTYVRREGNQLKYHMPTINVALLVAPYADEDGNIYFTDAVCITDHVEAAMAAHASGGRVIVSVSKIIPRNTADIGLSSEFVTAVVVNPWSEQTGGMRQRRCLPMLTSGATENVSRGMYKLKLINRIVGITSKRGAADLVITRMAAWLFSRSAHTGDLVNMGVGIPEEVGRLLYEHGIHSNYTFSTEAGALGGIPAPGVYFGAALNPDALHSSAWMFRHYQKHLSVAVFGFLQVDSMGNVNVSKRGEGIKNYVGPGGLINIAESAKTIIFVGHWMAGAEFRVRSGAIAIKKQGRPKFVSHVDEITFSGQRALASGKTVYYVTTVGVFQLTDQGLTLIHVMPGINIQRDIIDAVPATFVIPEDLKTVPEPVVTGNNFKIRADKRPEPETIESRRAV